MSSFCTKLDFSIFFTDFSWRKMRCTIASILKQKTLHSYGEMWCSDGVCLFLHQYQRILTALFCRLSAEITAFLLRKQAVNSNSLQKFYDNGASAVLRRLTTVSAEIPAFLEKYRRIAKKFDSSIASRSELQVKALSLDSFISFVLFRSRFGISFVYKYMKNSFLCHLK